MPRLAFDTHLAGQALTVKANGDFSGFDPAVVAGRPELAGNLSGSLNVEATVPSLAGPIDPLAVRAGGTVSLADSRVGEIAIARAGVDGQFADGAGDIRSLAVAGPDVDVHAKGRLDLRPDGASDLEYRASVASLETVGRMFNTEVSGNLTAEGRLTGNLASLQTKGTGSVSNLRYGSTSVLAAKTAYDVRVPDLEAARAEVTADTTATLLEVAGRQILEATAHTTWKDQTLGFDANVREQHRSLAARGDVVLHPDHQEVHLQDLDAECRGRRVADRAWQQGRDPVRRRSHRRRRRSARQRRATPRRGRSLRRARRRAQGPGAGRGCGEPEHADARHAADRRHAERERHGDGHTRSAAGGRDVLDS